MKYVTMKELLNQAQKGQYAVPAINVSNMETITAVLKGAHQCQSPIILQVAPIQQKIQKFRYRDLVEIIHIVARQYQGQYTIHLDHGETLHECREAIDSGFLSIMCDGSHRPFEENIFITRQAKDLCPSGVTLEGELGQIAGGEGGGEQKGDATYTDPALAAEFVARTGIDCLAISIGNAHGFYQGEPKLQFDVLKKIKERVSVPLVLHGASGLPQEQIKYSIENGICKINFFTEVDQEFVRGLQEGIDQNQYMMQTVKHAQDLMQSKVEAIIKICGSEERI